MSWENDSVTKSPCPCGQGTYETIYSSNDWGQHKVTWSMNCSYCQSNFSLYTYSYFRSGEEYEAHRWVKTENYKKSKSLDRKARKLGSEAVELARKKYLEKTVMFFSQSNKKQIWEVFNKNILNYKSLATFYKHTKGKDKPEYIRELFVESSIISILKIIKISDIKITNDLLTSNNYKKEAKELLEKA